MRNSETIWQLVDAKAQPCTELSDRVWGMPELACTEHRSCVEHTAMLEQQGFRHGCGHNLLGSASRLAATAVKEWLAASGVAGRAAGGHTLRLPVA